MYVNYKTLGITGTNIAHGMYYRALDVGEKLTPFMQNIVKEYSKIHDWLNALENTRFYKRVEYEKHESFWRETAAYHHNALSKMTSNDIDRFHIYNESSLVHSKSNDPVQLHLKL